MLNDLFADYTLRTVALGSALLGIVSGVIGAFAVLRRQSLLGDAMSHAALPGIVLAFVVTGSREPVALMIGAAFACWIGAMFVAAIVRTTRLKSDSALGLILATFFGAGLVLLTWVQQWPTAAQAGLDRYLFGQAATLLERDVITMAAIGLPALLILALFWKECAILAFDPDFATSIGLPVRLLDVLLTSLLAVAIIIGLQTVGAVLMSAMLVAPAAAARQWTDRLGVMVALSGIFGAAAGVIGALLSSTATRLPTGPLIIVCISALAFVSLLLAPRRGVVWAWLRNGRLSVMR
ncbi:MAG: metal ABC transporter permease [Roseiflexus sp.]|nr:metal ABC transporter permease [Roseiflexus sp.]MDW8148212.1 iron chelate uptake ABC transporter family permease subunit [Roseiflexaceae bacterium]